MAMDPKGDGSGLTLLAYAYSPSEAALMISALEGAGYDVFVPGYHMMANAQHFSVAFGGAKIMVPDDQAETAAALLAAISADTEVAQSKMPGARSYPGLLRRVAMSIVYFFTGTAPALNARFLQQKADVPDPKPEQEE
ncbi:hypothetical protein [Roseovarius sp. 2305UL8-3]|uniref:hypothetical protein n=1 Tax=Roseovarius conchicola TaxID=3121636 RepID=UPI0035278927